MVCWEPTWWETNNQWIGALFIIHRLWSLSPIEILSTVVRVAYSSLCPLLLAGRSLLDCGTPGNPRYVVFQLVCRQYFHFPLPLGAPQNKRLHRVQSAVVNREVFMRIDNYRVNYYRNLPTRRWLLSDLKHNSYGGTCRRNVSLGTGPNTYRCMFMCCHRLPLPEATKASRLPGLQSHPSPNWQESPHLLHSRPHTTQPTSVVSLRAGSRPRTHTTGHTSLSRTRPKSQLLENCKFIAFFSQTVFFFFHYQLFFYKQLQVSLIPRLSSSSLFYTFFNMKFKHFSGTRLASSIIPVCLQIPCLPPVFWLQCVVTCVLHPVLESWWRPWRRMPPEALSALV